MKLLVVSLITAFAVLTHNLSASAQSEQPPLSDLAGREPPAVDLVPRPVTSMAGAPAGKAELSLVLGMVQRPTRRDFNASAVLTLPFPKWLSLSSSHHPNVAEPATVESGAARGATTELVAAELGAAELGVVMTSTPTEHAARPSLPRVTHRDVRAAIAASQAHASETAALLRLDDMVNRARWSAALPELRLRATRLVDETASYSPTSYDDDRTTSSGGVSLWLEGRATWRLDRALFPNEELRVEQQRRQLHKAQAQLAHETTRLLYAWLRAVYLARDSAQSAEQCMEAWMREQLASAELNLITAGWHRQWLARKSALGEPWCVVDLHASQHDEVAPDAAEASHAALTSSFEVGRARLARATHRAAVRVGGGSAQGVSLSNAP